MSEFTGRKAIVTGATRGIGRAIASAFLAAGATVLGIYGSNEQAAAACRDEHRALGDRLQLFKCNVADYEEVKGFYQTVEAGFDTIDILVNNAGIRSDAVLAMMQPEEWQRVIDVNLHGSFYMSKHAVMLMMKQKYGRIIHISSPMAYLGFAGQSNYAASKAGQIGMMRSLARETASRKITVNCVLPGFIDTELLSGLRPEQLEEYRKLVPLKRFGRPEEVADAVLFLASGRASYITGAILEVNGGI